MAEDESEFDRFWRAFPKRVGRLAAQRAFQKARKIATLADILGGVATYTRTKPSYADWCHPATWLNAGRWMDEVEAKPAPLGAARRWQWEDCPHQPHCGSAGRCLQRQELDAYKAAAS